MPSLGQFFASIVGFNSQNSVSAGLIGNANFDFSIVRLPAPAEYAGLGSSLSLARRQEAEEGPIHRTARRLAALFEQEIPSAPKLMSAYGQRVSEIVEKPGVNPDASHSDGPFASFVGVDGTAIWAAATSGPNALGVCLLALLLARAWDSTKATSVWVELVNERKAEIKKGYMEHRNVSESSLISVLQDITRGDLWLWDASARSWLRSADQGMKWQLKQLELTTRDFQIPFGGGSTTYEKVMLAWKNAMNCLESLLCGRPQNISDAAVLVGISAWHLFPNLLVLRERTTDVPFRDHLFPSTAKGTIGLESAQPSYKGGIRWSLSLSHLQYYGPPVEVKSQMDTPRVTIGQFRLAALGCLFRKWEINHRQFLMTARWIADLWKVLSEDDESSHSEPASKQLKWLFPIVQASQDLLDAEAKSEAALSDATRLVTYGQRRGKGFLDAEGRPFGPFFGLCNAHVLSGLQGSDDIECGVKYLRSIAAQSQLQPQQGFIAYSNWIQASLRATTPDFYEYATLAPPQSEDLEEVSHTRWLHKGEHLTHDKTANSLGGDQKRIKTFINARRENVQAHGENFYVLETGPTFSVTVDPRAVGSVIEWHNAPSMFRTSSHEHLQRKSGEQKKRPLKRPRVDDTCNSEVSCGNDMIKFTRVYGDLRFGLYIRSDQQSPLSVHEPIDPIRSIVLIREKTNRTALWNYMCGIARTTTMPIPLSSDIGISQLTTQCEMSGSACQTLESLHAAASIFESTKSPTISLEVIERPLHLCSWTPEATQQSRKPGISDTDEGAKASVFTKLPICVPLDLTRPQSFACVLYMDSGHHDLEPHHFEKVLAISSENSIYVAGVILSDPTSPAIGHDIRRIAGNIGRGGVSLLIAPQDPKIRSLSNDYRVVTHAPYDHKREDNFQSTSMHLSFTDWEQSIDTGGTRLIDQEVKFVESVISVHEKGAWVADLDILGIAFDHHSKLSLQEPCPGHRRSTLKYDYASIDSWDEFLDAPTSVGIFRAHDNWVARLSAVSILFQQDQGHALGLFDDSDLCLECLEKMTLEKSIVGQRRDFDQYESCLPTFCID